MIQMNRGASKSKFRINNVPDPQRRKAVMKRYCRAIVLLALVACAPLQTVPTQAQTATPPVHEFLQTFDSAQELDSTAWTASAWQNATRAHSPSNVTVKDG